jgi:hypothetical protein
MRALPVLLTLLLGAPALADPPRPSDPCDNPAAAEAASWAVRTLADKAQVRANRDESVCMVRAGECESANLLVEAGRLAIVHDSARTCGAQVWVTDGVAAKTVAGRLLDRLGAFMTSPKGALVYPCIVHVPPDCGATRKVQPAAR